jgi:hypothetical protein
MEQLTEAYKRRMTIYSLIIGAVLSIFLNADTLQIARTLFDDPSVRATLIAAAEEAIASGELAAAIPTATLSPTLAPTPLAGMTPTPVTTPVAAGQAAGDTSDQPSEDTGVLVGRVEEILDQLLRLNLPLAWESTAIEGGCFGSPPDDFPQECESSRNVWLFAPANNPGWLGLWLRKLLGMIITVIAIAQGAPFWFDLLNRLVRGRS